MRYSICLFVLLAELTSAAPTSLAEIVRFDLEGTLANISGLQSPPANLPVIGSSFSGSFVFDTDAQDTSGSTFFGTYHTPFPTGVVALRVGDWEWKETGEAPVTIVVGNDTIRGPLPEFDSYFVGDSRIELLTPEEPLPNLGEYWLFRWDLEGPANIFASTALPQDAFALEPWTTNRWSISLWGSPPAPLLELSGVVSSFESVVVPEPSSLLYVVIAWCVWSIHFKLKRKPADFLSGHLRL
jgi:hypothetical protein